MRPAFLRRICCIWRTSICYINPILQLLPNLGSKLLNRLLSKRRIQLLNRLLSKHWGNWSKTKRKIREERWGSVSIVVRMPDKSWSQSFRLAWDFTIGFAAKIHTFFITTKFFECKIARFMIFCVILRIVKIYQEK